MQNLILNLADANFIQSLCRFPPFKICPKNQRQFFFLKNKILIKTGSLINQKLS